MHFLQSSMGSLQFSQAKLREKCYVCEGELPQ
jgi:hypothetical protein